MGIVLGRLVADDATIKVDDAADMYPIIAEAEEAHTAALIVRVCNTYTDLADLVRRWQDDDTQMDASDFIADVEWLMRAEA